MFDHFVKFALKGLIRNKSQCCQTPVQIPHCVRNAQKQNFSDPNMRKHGPKKNNVFGYFLRNTTAKTLETKGDSKEN